MVRRCIIVALTGVNSGSTGMAIKSATPAKPLITIKPVI
jgi:hypothetical protein